MVQIFHLHRILITKGTKVFEYKKEGSASKACRTLFFIFSHCEHSEAISAKTNLRSHNEGLLNL